MNFKNKLLFVLALLLLLSSYSIVTYLSQSDTVKALEVVENTSTIDGLPNDDPNEKPIERDNFFGSVLLPENRANDHGKNADDFKTIKLVENKPIEKSNMTNGTNF